MQYTTKQYFDAAEFDSDTPKAASAPAVETPIDPKTLARLDYGLFKTLSRMGTPRERICSALCLSYAEYEYIEKLVETRKK